LANRGWAHEGHEDCVTVGRRGCRCDRTDNAARTPFVLDHDRLTKPLFKLERQRTPQAIGQATSCDWNN
jgi:hypothetical protein